MHVMPECIGSDLIARDFVSQVSRAEPGVEGFGKASSADDAVPNATDQSRRTLRDFRSRARTSENPKEGVWYKGVVEGQAKFLARVTHPAGLAEKPRPNQIVCQSMTRATGVSGGCSSSERDTETRETVRAIPGSFDSNVHLI